MLLSREQFVASIHEECFEEACFLYQQRRLLLAQGRLTQKALGRLERRLDAFVEAVVVGGDAAVSLCLERATRGGIGESYSATRVLSRLGMREQLAALLMGLREDSREQAIAFLDGLCHELPEGHLPTPEQLPSKTTPEVTAILATALGHGRRGRGEWVLAQLQQVLSSGSMRGADAYVQALGRLRPHGAEAVLWRCLESGEAALRLEAAIALLRLGDLRVVHSLLAPGSFPSWACLAVGLSCGPSAVPRLKAFVAREENASEALLALGLLGDASAVPELLTHLEHPSCAGAAAESLELLTGAGLLERVEQSDAVPGDEASPDHPRVTPPRTLESASGTIRVRPSRTVSEWRRWWEKHRSQLPPGRLRSGVPCSPGQLLEALGAGVGAGCLRQLLAEELVIRYGLDVGFEPTSLLLTQARHLARGHARLKEHRNGFSQGRWYRGGVLAP
ncbi:hypothetical protein F0U60_30340 [Archangium minus]|uniref:TIGR02270 family protein n=1 Tax=Archangium minus TaxID=83450 RepID=A0ABY9WXT7_9BACT|nr:hypothetical protein F0U60_30340 [Archangium minus]